MVIFLAACTKIVSPPSPIMDLGVKSTSTSIKSISQIGNIVTAEFETTIGSKYSVQIIPFGSETPVKTLGFTALTDTVTKTYDLNSLDKKDYDIILIDINGTETKRPIKIK